MRSSASAGKWRRGHRTPRPRLLLQGAHQERLPSRKGGDGHTRIAATPIRGIELPRDRIRCTWGRSPRPEGCARARRSPCVHLTTAADRIAGFHRLCRARGAFPTRKPVGVLTLNEALPYALRRGPVAMMPEGVLGAPGGIVACMNGWAPASRPADSAASPPAVRCVQGDHKGARRALVSYKVQVGSRSECHHDNEPGRDRCPARRQAHTA